MLREPGFEPWKWQYGFGLDQNHANPFTASTRIRYTLTNPGHVSIVVYDILGRPVARLVDEFQTAGHHAVVFNAVGLSSGLYLCRLVAGVSVAASPMTLLK